MWEYMMILLLLVRLLKSFPFQVEIIEFFYISILTISYLVYTVSNDLGTDIQLVTVVDPGF